MGAMDLGVEPQWRKGASKEHRRVLSLSDKYGIEKKTIVVFWSFYKLEQCSSLFLISHSQVGKISPNQLTKLTSNPRFPHKTNTTKHSFY